MPCFTSHWAQPAGSRGTAEHSRATATFPTPNAGQHTPQETDSSAQAGGCSACQGLQCVVLGMPLAPNHTQCQAQLPPWLQPTDPTLASMQTASALSTHTLPCMVCNTYSTRAEAQNAYVLRHASLDCAPPRPGCCTTHVNTLTTAALALQQPRTASLLQ